MIATVIISILLLAAVSLIIRSLIKRHRSGSSGCGCSCDSCFATTASATTGCSPKSTGQAS